MRARIALLVVCLATGPVAQADTLFGVYAGAGAWKYDLNGDVATDGVRVDSKTDMALGDDQDNMFYVAVEHGVPLIPNFKVAHSSVSSVGARELGRTIVFDGIQFDAPEAIRSEIEFDQTDFIAYYELLDNVVSLDLGLAARQLDGSVTVASFRDSAEVDFDGTIPMLYSRFRFELLSGWWFGVEAQGVSYDGNELLDGNAQLGWESDLGLGIEVGYRHFRLKMDDLDDIQNGTLDIDGPYAALNYHF